MREITKIIIHCSATPPDMDVGVAEIRRWHADPPPKGNGWNDIGYHFVIRRDGQFERGRPVEIQGAHCAAQNGNKASIGICMVGGVRRGLHPKTGKPALLVENNFTHSQWLTLEQQLELLQIRFPKIDTILGHRDLDPGKECPSFSVRDWSGSARWSGRCGVTSPTSSRASRARRNRHAHAHSDCRRLPRRGLGRTRVRHHRANRSAVAEVQGARPRVSPHRQVDMTDPVQAAVKVATIEQTMLNLQARMSDGFLTMGSRLDAMQADQRESARVQAEVSTQLRDLQSHSDGLNRLAIAIERQAAENSSWRDRHEIDNRAVADKVTRFGGWVGGFGVLGMLIAGGAWAWVTTRFEQVDARAAENVLYQTRDLGRLEAKHDKDIQDVRSDISELRKLKVVK